MIDYVQQDKAIQDNLSRQKYGPKTIKAYMYWIGQLHSYFPAVEVKDITFEQIKEYIDFLVLRKKLAANTVHQAAWTFSTVFREVFGKDYDIKSLKLPKRSYDLPIILTKNEISDLLHNTDDKKFKLIFATMYGAGLTIGELRRLKVSDIYFTHRYILVQQTQGKSPRKTTLAEYLAKELEDYLQKYCPVKWLFEGKDKGSQISSDVIQRSFRKSLDLARIDKDVSTRNLKYSYVKHLEGEGIPLRQILKEMGMASAFRSRTYYFYAQLGGEYEVEHIHSPLDTIFKSESSNINTKDLKRALTRLKNEDEKEYLLEAINCIESGVYRAGVIFAWTAAISNIHQRCFKYDSIDLNAAIKKYYPGAPTIKRIEDFSYIKDNTVLEASRELGIFDSNEKNVLVECLSTRNKCGHPGNYKPKPLKVAAFFEDLINVVFLKS